jgi:large subunit ribosomal protein L2
MSKALKKLKPTTPGSRGTVFIDKRHLWKGKPEKSLTVRLKNTGGRNNRGVVTCAGKGGGHKKIYRIIDFHRTKDKMEAIVDRIEYDPNRTAFIALIKYTDGTKSYILAPNNLKIGDTIMSGSTADILNGNCLELDNIPMGTMIHNVELVPGQGGKLVRSAGSFASLTGKEMGFAILRLPSGELRRVSLKCRATVGIVSNLDLFNENLGKAGRNRLRGVRPKVRGICKNPVDHPNGGRTSGGKVFRNKTGRVIKGKRTRKINKQFSHLIIKRRKK